MFHFVDDQLHCENVPLSKIQEEVGTPTYVYSADLIRQNVAAYKAADPDAIFAYALKANQNIEILKLIRSCGFGADVTSGGELYLALEAGFDPQKIIFSGVGKRDDEILMAFDAGISSIHVESTAEMGVIEKLAAERGIRAKVGVRLNPNVDAETHPYISTGLLENKFGVPIDAGMELIRYAHASSHLTPTGVAMHIGSQIRDISSFIEAANLVADVALELKSAGIELEYVDLGGGLGIDYQQAESDRVAPTAAINAWVSQVGAPVRRAGLAVKAEPGRSIVGAAGALLSQITFTKNNGAKTFYIADAGMNDLIRPPLYSAHHPIVSVSLTGSDPADQELAVDVVGPICESSDFLGKNVQLPKLQRGALIAVMNAGAYSFAMSSNYNGRLRAAEVLVDGDSWRIIRPRQQYADLL